MKLLKTTWKWLSTVVGFVTWVLFAAVLGFFKNLFNIRNLKIIIVYITIGCGIVTDYVITLDPVWLDIVLTLPVYVLLLRVIDVGIDGITVEYVEERAEHFAQKFFDTIHDAATQIQKKYDLPPDFVPTFMYMVAGYLQAHEMRGRGFDVEVDVVKKENDKTHTNEEAV